MSNCTVPETSYGKLSCTFGASTLGCKNMQICWTSGSQMPAIFKHRTNGVKVSSVKFAFVLISVIVNMHCSFVQHKSSIGILPPVCQDRDARIGE